MLAEKFRVFCEEMQQAVEIQLRLKSEQRTSCAARQHLSWLCVQQGQGPGHEDQEQPPAQSPRGPQGKAVQPELVFALLENDKVGQRFAPPEITSSPSINPEDMAWNTRWVR